MKCRHLCSFTLFPHHSTKMISFNKTVSSVMSDFESFHKDKSTVTHTNTQKLELFNPCHPHLIYGREGSSRYWFHFTVSCLTSRLPVVSHHTSLGVGAEDDTQLECCMTPCLCFLSDTLLRSLSNTNNFLTSFRLQKYFGYHFHMAFLL